MSGFSLRGRSKDWLGQFGRFPEARRQLDPANGLPLAVLLPARAGQIAAHDAFDGQGLRLPDDHAAARELVCKRHQVLRQGFCSTGEKMIRLKSVGLIKPEIRYL